MKTTSLEQSLEISNVCQDILSISPEIHFSCYINRNGRIVESKFRDDGLITDLSSQELEMRYMQCKLQSTMNKEFEDKIGRLDYTLICRESTLELIFPFFDGIIFIVANKNLLFSDIYKKISNLLTMSGFGSKMSRY
jgi:hypothetical protein